MKRLARTWALLAVLAAGLGAGQAAFARVLGPWVRSSDGGATQAVWPSAGKPTFVASCDAARHELILDYRGGGAKAFVARGLHMAILGDSSKDPPETVTLRIVEIKPQRLVGRVKVSPKLIRTLENTAMAIEAPQEEMDEPWYFGRSEPLLKVARACL